MPDLTAFEAALGQTDEFAVLTGLIETQLSYVADVKRDADSSDIVPALMLLNDALEAVAGAVAILGGAA